MPCAAIVVTSIAAPNQVMRELAAGALERGSSFIVIGDVPSPADFQLDGCEFFSVLRQEQTGLKTAALSPQASLRPQEHRLSPRRPGQHESSSRRRRQYPQPGLLGAPNPRAARCLHARSGWVNAYASFSDENIWPRGLPLDKIQSKPPAFDTLQVQETDCPIQQGLADGDPDVDAIYRLIFPVSTHFRADRRLAFGEGAWCPFNSQNTTWWPDALRADVPACILLVSHDRHLAQFHRAAHRLGERMVDPVPRAHGFQLHNEHNLMRDFRNKLRDTHITGRWQNFWKASAWLRCGETRR